METKKFFNNTSIKHIKFEIFRKSEKAVTCYKQSRIYDTSDRNSLQCKATFKFPYIFKGLIYLTKKFIQIVLKSYFDMYSKKTSRLQNHIEYIIFYDFEL